MKNSRKTPRGRLTREGWHAAIFNSRDPIEKIRYAFTRENNAEFYRERDALAYLRSNGDLAAQVLYVFSEEEYAQAVRETDEALLEAVGEEADRWRNEVVPQSRGSKLDFFALSKKVDRSRIFEACDARDANNFDEELFNKISILVEAFYERWGNCKFVFEESGICFFTIKLPNDREERNLRRELKRESKLLRREERMLAKEEKRLEREMERDLDDVREAVAGRDVIIIGESRGAETRRHNKAASEIRRFTKRWGESQKVEDISRASRRKLMCKESRERQRDKERNFQEAVEAIRNRDVIIEGESRTDKIYRQRRASLHVNYYHDHYGYSKHLDDISTASRRYLASKQNEI